MNGAVNLYLVGFMGTGKSSVGRLLAQRLGMGFVDSDREIEARRGKTVAEIFESEGEEAFRELEREFVMEGHEKAGMVVACGGGLAVQPGMMGLLKERGMVVCLQASPEVVLQRTEGRKHRPLLNTEDPMGKILELYEKRMPFYREAHSIILTDGRMLPEVVEHVLRAYRGFVETRGDDGN